MRTIPVDSTRCVLIATGKSAQRMEYVELSDGSRKRSGNAAKDEATGLTLWVVDCLVQDDDADRAEIVSVRVPSADEPVTKFGDRVQFRGLVAVPYADRNTGRVALSMRAEAIESQGQHGKPQPQKPAENAA